jgi:3-hydroxyacyl-CoA dehydrogenase
MHDEDETRTAPGAAGPPHDAPVAVVGAGLTGASWAGLYAAAGLEVRLHDVDEARLEAAVERAAAAAGFLAGSGLADMQTAERGVALLTGTADLEAAVAGVQHVQECVREDLALKRLVIAAIDKAAPAEALICTSSSGLSISDIQTAATRPERCLAAHPYNPPHLVPLVELAPGALTAPEALERAFTFYASVGKEPVKLTRDIPGYLANRLSAALWREAVDLVLRGIATVEDVDKAVSAGPGLRWAAMGPHLLYDLGGGEEGIVSHVEHLAAVKEGMLRDLATWTEFPSETGAALDAGLAEEKGARTYDELVAERDALLVAYLRARREQRD